MKVTVVIPARYASTRFEGKPLAILLGKPMIQHVYERSLRAKGVDSVIVATDDDRIFDAVKSFGGRVLMTSSGHATGTDRLAEAAAGLDSDLIVNVQGDEPLIYPRMIEAAVEALRDAPSAAMSTLKHRIRDVDEITSSSVVKVVVDRDDFALYFSRHAIPFNRDEDRGSHVPVYYKHIGLYVYRRDFLTHFAGMASTPLENAEKLEQLRVLENGYRIKVVTTEYDTIGVDEPQDLIKAEEILKEISREYE
ncbi:MAG: 3-deoxy-manno-octulosonate cytidylyltransferase [bacterium]|nr:3-deoxy-manno-octulosonate cytidylyltransferase [bacterium]